jgi:metal-responsive CopG/Arc/MetJ family transcriptional regulator
VEIIQIVIEKQLLEAADQVARRTKQNRSALVRDALREYLLKLELRAREEHDRAGYSRKPQVRDEGQDWEAEAVWPQK